tara:strand:- start:611 stop:1864 length:1254 start_codon:yes stop_codon:yes gene_type:complete
MTHALSGFSGGRVSGYIGDDGVTAGDAIRYDVVQYKPDGVTESPSFQKYRKAQADQAENAEIIGIIESIDAGIVNVVLAGQMIYPDRIVSATHVDETLGTSGATGGNDIYFLSEVTAGAVQNLAPSEPTKIAKPILQQAADGTFTHHVVNYIGYQIGGQVVASDNEGGEPLMMKTVLDFGTINGNKPIFLQPWEFDGALKNNIAPITKNSTEFAKRQKTFSKLAKGKLEGSPFGSEFVFVASTKFVASLWLNKKIQVGTWKGTCFQVGTPQDINKNCIYVRTSETSGPDISLRCVSVTSNESVVILSAEQCGVMLPTIINQPKKHRTTSENGSVIVVRERIIISAEPDDGRLAVTVPQELRVSKLVAGSLQAENSTLSVSDVAAAIDTLASEIESVKKAVHGSSTNVDALTNLTANK